MTMEASARKKARADEVVAAADFKAKCLALFDQVERDGRCFIVPLPESRSTSLRGSLLHEEDLLEPVDVKWDAHG
jgi:hypothetical protein